MSRSNDKHALAVGLFILIGIVIIVTGIFMVGSQEKFFSKRFIIKCSFSDVGGLQAGNNIWLSGVKVGTVKTISFKGDAQVEVTMNIDEKAKHRIWKNSMAKISTDGFIGNKIVIIYGGSSKAGIVSDEDRLHSAKGASTDEVMDVLSNSNQNLLQITTNLKDITAQIKEGKGVLGSLIYEQDLQKDLQATLLHFKQAGARSEEVMRGLQDFTATMNNKNGLIHELLTDTAVFHSLQSSIHQLNSTIVTAAAFMNNLDTASAVLSDRDKPAGMLLNDEETAKEMKEIITNLKSGSQKLDEDLKALQHNFLLRGYFRKKAKGKLKGY